MRKDVLSFGVGEADPSPISLMSLWYRVGLRVFHVSAVPARWVQAPGAPVARWLVPVSVMGSRNSETERLGHCPKIKLSM